MIKVDLLSQATRHKNRRASGHHDDENGWHEGNENWPHAESPKNVYRENAIDKMDDRLLTREDAARYLNISPQTLANFAVTGRGPRMVILSRRCVRYRLIDLREFVSQRLTSSLTT